MHWLDKFNNKLEVVGCYWLQIKHTNKKRVTAKFYVEDGCVIDILDYL